jgi:hypothetical protein
MRGGAHHRTDRIKTRSAIWGLTGFSEGGCACVSPPLAETSQGAVTTGKFKVQSSKLKVSSKSGAHLNLLFAFYFALSTFF